MKQNDAFAKIDDNDCRRICNKLLSVLHDEGLNCETAQVVLNITSRIIPSLSPVPGGKIGEGCDFRPYCF